MSAEPALPLDPFVTYAEYLAMERDSETKHEFVAGRVVAMAGGTPEHARLASKVGHLFRLRLGGRPCETFSSDLRVRIEATNRSTYPDLTIVCGGIETSPIDPDAVVNPTVLVEVLSPSTETTDRLEKWAHYRRIPSLEAYVLVSHRERRIEAYRRDGRRWIFEEAGPGESLRVGGVEVDLAVDEVYDSVLSA